MTIQEIVDKILAYHPDIGDRRTCDVIVGADPNREYGSRDEGSHGGVFLFPLHQLFR